MAEARKGSHAKLQNGKLFFANAADIGFRE
jgi:hypothetical protein